MRATDPAVRWLVQSADPSVRFFTFTELCGQSPRTGEAAASRHTIPNSPRIHALLRGQRAHGGFGVPPYKKRTVNGGVLCLT